VSAVEVMQRVAQLRAGLGLSRPPASSAGGADFAAALARATGTSTMDGSGRTGQDAVTAAKRYLGVPYVFGSTDPKTGLDCSALVQRAYADIGVELPRIAADQAREGEPVANLAQARPGDLLAFNSPVDHITIYLGDGMMIAAPQPGERVKIQKVYDTPTAIRRIIPDAPAILPALRPAALQSASGLRSTTAVPGSGALAANAVPYADLFSQAAARYGLPPALLAAVARVESGYDPSAVSPAGAQGLMQLMPGTAQGLGVDPFNPAQAIDGAARLLSRDLRDFGSLPLALAAYNAGAGAVRQYGGIPPYAETQAYVPKVEAAMAALQQRRQR